MTVKLNRFGYLFNPSQYIRYLMWLGFYAYIIYIVITNQYNSIVVLIPITAIILIVEAYFLFYLSITSFQVREGEIEYYDKISTNFGRSTKYEKMGFVIKDIRSIEIKQGVIEKLFGFAHIKVVGESEAASEFDKYRIPQRKYHHFYGVKNSEDLYDELCKFFPVGIVENNAEWR